MVISMQSDKDLAEFRISKKKLLKDYEAAGIEFCQIATDDFDREMLCANASTAVAEIENALAPPWAKVYLHCTAGINRAPTIAAAYLIKTADMSAQAAYDYVIARRRCKPYLEVLQRYEESLNTDRQICSLDEK
jgi:protein-tyrosine phosphatase